MGVTVGAPTRLTGGRARRPARGSLARSCRIEMANDRAFTCLGTGSHEQEEGKRPKHGQDPDHAQKQRNLLPVLPDVAGEVVPGPGARYVTRVHAGLTSTRASGAAGAGLTRRSGSDPRRIGNP